MLVVQPQSPAGRTSDTGAALDLERNSMRSKRDRDWLTKQNGEVRQCFSNFRPCEIVLTAGYSHEFIEYVH